MKNAIATKDWQTVSGDSGKANCRLLYDLAGARPGEPLPEPVQAGLKKEQVLHCFRDGGPHSPGGVGLVVAGSAGDGFVRPMKKRRAGVLLAGETDPRAALRRSPAGAPLPDLRFGITTTLCKLHGLIPAH